MKTFFFIFLILSSQLYGGELNLPNSSAKNQEKSASVLSSSTEFLSFDLHCENLLVEIEWSVANEFNVDYYLIERSSDDENYEAFGLIEVNANSSEKKKYRYTDDRPVSGTSYYRIKLINIEGQEIACRRKEISCKGNNEGVKIYPNPNNGVFVLEGAKLYSEVTVFDRFGRLVYENKKLVAKEQINLSHLENGVYFIVVIDSKGKTVLKFIIL